MTAAELHQLGDQYLEHEGPRMLLAKESEEHLATYQAGARKMLELLVDRMSLLRQPMNSAVQQSYNTGMSTLLSPFQELLP